MNTDPDLEKFDALQAQIESAKSKGVVGQEAEEDRPVKSSNIGFEFLGAILGSAFLGWLVDKSLGTKPWGLLILMITGFVVGIMGIWRALGNQKSE